MEPMDKGLAVPKMGADKSTENTPNAPEIYLPKLSVQAQKFGKASLGICSPCSHSAHQSEAQEVANNTEQNDNDRTLEKSSSMQMYVTTSNLIEHYFEDPHDLA